MASPDFAKARILFSRGECRQVGTDTPVPIRIYHPGSAAVTSVTVDNGANTLVLIDANATTTITLSAAATNTVGEVVDTINNVSGWGARVLDGLRSDAVEDKLVAGAITSATVDGVVVWDVLSITDAIKQFALSLAYDRGFSKQNSRVHRVHLQEFVYYATLGGVAAGNVLVVERDVNGVETTLFSDLSVSAATTTTNFAGGRGKITGADGSELIVVLKDSVTLADAAANLLRIIGIVE